jgi:predicted CoA-binding protein
MATTSVDPARADPASVDPAPGDPASVHSAPGDRAGVDPAIEAFLAERAIAVVGVSRTRGFANTAATVLRDSGYRVFPVNERADEIAGERCYRALSAIPEPVGAVLVVVPPARSAEVVRICGKLGIRKVWLQQGAESPDALAAAVDGGVSCVARECVLMYVRPRGIHRLHRWFHDRRRRRGQRA